MVESCLLVWISFGAVICGFVWGDLGLELLLGRAPGHVVWWCCDAKKISVPQRGFELLIEEF